METKILTYVTEHYLCSKDYNWIPVTKISWDLKIDYLLLLEEIKRLVLANQIIIQSWDNPFIIRATSYSQEEQLKFLEEAKDNKTESVNWAEFINFSIDSHLLCAYPSLEHLKQLNVTVNPLTPYSNQLKFLTPQITPIYFDLDILDRYYKDPRYHFTFHDYSWSIWYKESTWLREHDEIFLDTFWLGFDENWNRKVTTFLRYLGNLSPEHQQFWKSKESTQECKILSEYYGNTILWEWTTSHSIFSAFIEEQRIINQLTNTIFWKELFRETFEWDNKPKDFWFFFSPTLENYNNFIHLLDKMISENINDDFFESDLRYEEITLEDGRIERRIVWSLKRLEKWLNSIYTPKDNIWLSCIFDPFRKIRKLRQDPAHKINDNVYDDIYVEKQNELIKEVYTGISFLRNVFQWHPKVRWFIITKWLDDWNIKIF